MIELFHFIQENLSINKYLIGPFLISTIVFISIINGKHNLNWISLVVRIGTVFSSAVAIEYIMMFLVFDFLPGELNVIEKVIIFAGIIITFIMILNDAADGTKLGKWTTGLINRYALKSVDIEPVPYSEHLLKLSASQKKIKTDDENMTKEGCIEYIEHVNALITKLQVSTNAENIQSECNICYEKINSYLNLSSSDLSRFEAKNDVMLSTSRLAGKIIGLTGNSINEK